MHDLWELRKSHLYISGFKFVLFLFFIDDINPSMINSTACEVPTSGGFQVLTAAADILIVLKVIFYLIV